MSWGLQVACGTGCVGDLFALCLNRNQIAAGGIQDRSEANAQGTGLASNAHTPSRSGGKPAVDLDTALGLALSQEAGGLALHTATDTLSGELINSLNSAQAR